MGRRFHPSLFPGCSSLPTKHDLQGEPGSGFAVRQPGQLRICYVGASGNSSKTGLHTSAEVAVMAAEIGTVYSISQLWMSSVAAIQVPNRAGTTGVWLIISTLSKTALSFKVPLSISSHWTSSSLSTSGRSHPCLHCPSSLYPSPLFGLWYLSRVLAQCPSHQPARLSIGTA